MPLYKTFTPNSQTTVKIWKIAESYEALKADIVMKPDSEERVLGMKSEIHQRGFLSVRHLLATFGYSDTDLYYDSVGKPHLKDGKHISISHSFIFSAVAISDQPIGVDVEKQREKIGIIAHKFVKYENDYLYKDATNYINKLTVIWCVKESLYKIFATPGMLFKEHFLVIPFMLEDQTTTAWIDYNNFKHRFSADFIEFEGFTCAYALPL